MTKATTDSVNVYISSNNLPRATSAEFLLPLLVWHSLQTTAAPAAAGELRVIVCLSHKPT